MNKYELSVLYHPDLEVDLSKAEAKVSKAVGETGGKITKTDNAGKRKLAYPIKKQDFAVYVFYIVELPPNGPPSLEKVLNITDEVLRYLIIKDESKLRMRIEAKKTAKKTEKTPEKSKIKGGKKDEERDGAQF